MKNILILPVFVVIGFVGVYLYFSENPRQLPNISPLPFTKSHFSLEHAPSTAIGGSIVSLTGTVSWQSRISTMPAVITSVKPLQQGEAIQTGENGKTTIEFPEIGSISLLPKTKLSVIQTLPASAVFLQEDGTAEYTKIGTIPLAIRSLHMLTEQQAGIMTIVVDEKKQIVTIRVLQGLIIAAFNDAQNISTEITVRQGKQFVFNDDTRQTTIKSF